MDLLRGSTLDKLMSNVGSDAGGLFRDGSMEKLRRVSSAAKVLDDLLGDTQFWNQLVVRGWRFPGLTVPLFVCVR
jgi:hypothetical protein